MDRAIDRHYGERGRGGFVPRAAEAGATKTRQRDCSLLVPDSLPWQVAEGPDLCQALPEVARRASAETSPTESRSRRGTALSRCLDSLLSGAGRGESGARLDSRAQR